MKVKSYSVQSRLRLFQLGVALSVLVIAAGTFIANDVTSIKGYMVRNIASISGTLSRSLGRFLSYQEEHEVTKLMESLKFEEEIDLGLVLDSRRALFAKYGSLQNVQMEFPEKWDEVAAHEFRDGFLHYYEKIYDEEYLVGYLYLQVRLDRLNELYYRYFVFTAIIIVLCLILAFFSSRRLQRELGIPLSEMESVIREMLSAGDLSQRLKKAGLDQFKIQELTSLSSSFDKLFDFVEKSQHELAQLNANLEKLVAQRTKELHRELKSIENLLNNMQQALFVIDSQGQIQHPVSAYSQKLFNTELTGKNIYQTVLTSYSEDDQFMKTLKSCFLNTFTEGDMQWELTIDEFPNKFQFEDRTMAVSWAPIWDNEELLSHIMLVIQDVTELEQAEAEVRAKQQETAILYQLSHLPSREMENKLSGLYQLYLDAEKLIHSGEFNSDTVKDCFRSLHTLKGNSRLMHLLSLADETHHLENTISHIRDAIDENKPIREQWVKDSKTQSAELRGIFKSYTETAAAVFKVPDIISDDAFKKLKEAIASNNSNTISDIGQTLQFSRTIEANKQGANFEKLLQAAVRDFVESSLYRPEQWQLEDWQLLEKSTNDFIDKKVLLPKGSFLNFLADEYRGDPDALKSICNINIALEATRSGDVGSAESASRAVSKQLQESFQISDPGICFDASNPLGKATTELMSRLNKSQQVEFAFLWANLTHPTLSIAGRLRETGVYREIPTPAWRSQDVDTLSQLVLGHPDGESLQLLLTEFYTLVGEVAESLEKRVVLQLKGNDVFIKPQQKNMLGDVLTHMLRNSLDHGIESPGDREQVGKRPLAVIEIESKYENNQLELFVRDDGKGIDAEFICQKAIEKGLIEQPRADQMSWDEKVELIMTSGFSTAEKVTSLSGRGVGLDAVRSYLESHGGRVSISSELGKSTEFKIELPI